MGAPADAAEDRESQFEREIAPLLISRCLECHSSQPASGGLLLTSEERLRAGGDSGPAVVPGEALRSLLLIKVREGEMPPPVQGQSQALSALEMDRLRTWIDAGAPWPEGRILDPFEMTTDTRAGRDWWALRPVEPGEPPAVGNNAWVRNPIDAFVWQRLERAGLEPAPPAAPREKLRRLYYDLIGLPPSLEDLEQFAADPSEAAWEAAIDRLLASPQYGERWGRYWLDIVRYADTSGYERDQEKPFAWRYRDWVVNFLNADRPYHRFILEQLAGDELPDRTEDSVIATGLLRLGTWNDEPNDPEEYQFERLEDLVHVTSTAFLGLTVKCARCHDHKFDPIPQADYYRMAAAFWPGPISPRERDLLGGPSSEELGFEQVLGWTDVRTDPPPFHLLLKGDPAHPGEVIVPGALSFLPQLPWGAELPGGFEPDGPSTGHRLRLAAWIAHPDNPLTTRVFVNRVWQHHFGEGLVRSSDNFGFQGDHPTHPELLDWLAAEFVANGWRLKPLHKLLLMSNTWQQSAQHPRWNEYAQIDADNRLWWRAERQRLDAEALRDSLLFVSGRLDLRQGGPGFRPWIDPAALEGLSRKEADWSPSEPSEQLRRSLYMFNKRGLLPPLMTTFDLCDSTLPCGRRDVTTVPSQALTLMNNPFLHECSAALAARVASFARDDPREQVVHVWRFALGRDPESVELEAAVAFLERQQVRLSQEFPSRAAGAALDSLCLAILNTNEFVYVD